MKKHILVSLLFIYFSCINKQASTEDAYFELKTQVKRNLPESVPLGKALPPKLITLNFEYLEYYDFKTKKVLKVDFETGKEEESYINEWGGYLYYYKENDYLRAISYGWVNSPQTTIETKGSEKVIFSDNIISDCLNEKVIFSATKEGIDVKNLTQLYNAKTKKTKNLNIKNGLVKFIDDNTLLVSKGIPEYDDKVSLMKYNLLDDSFTVILSPFKISNTIKYLKKEKLLYYVTNSLVHRLSLDTKKIEIVHEEEISLPIIVDNNLLIGYVFDKPSNAFKLTYINL